MKTISRTAIEASLDGMDQEQMSRVLVYIQSLLNKKQPSAEEKRRKALAEIRQALQAKS